MLRRRYVSFITQYNWNVGLKDHLEQMEGVVDYLIKVATWFVEAAKRPGWEAKCTTMLPGMLHTMGHDIPGTPFKDYYPGHQPWFKKPDADNPVSYDWRDVCGEDFPQTCF